jgi:hypothetical protein
MAKQFDDTEWIDYDWTIFYPGINGEIFPPGRPKEKGNSVQNHFCDASHDKCHVTRRSTTGIKFFLNVAHNRYF